MSKSAAVPTEKPKPLKGFLNKRGPTAMTSWNRRWFVLEDNKVRTGVWPRAVGARRDCVFLFFVPLRTAHRAAQLTYFKEQTDTAYVASVSLEDLQSLNKTVDVAPKKTDPALAFTLDVREGKDVRTYYLCAGSEAEKKQWIDGIVASRKYWAAVKAGTMSASPPPSRDAKSTLTPEKEKELLSTIAQLKAENLRLQEEYDELLDDFTKMKSKHDEEVETLRSSARSAEVARTAVSGRGGGSPATPKVSGRGRGSATVVAPVAVAKKKAAADDDPFADEVPDFDSEDNDNDSMPPLPKTGSPRGSASPRESNARARDLKESSSSSSKGDAETQKKLNKALGEVFDLQAKLQEAEEALQEQKEMIDVLKMEKSELEDALAAAKEKGGGGGGGGGDEDTQALHEEIALLTEELEEARTQAEDYKKRLLELRVQYRKLGGK